MKNSYHPAQRLRHWLPLVILGVWGGVSLVHAQVSLEATVTSLGGSFRYDISVDNSTNEDLAIVSLVSAPLFDPLIDPSLVTPPGFRGSYDGGLGFVDFLADTDIFARGTTISGFRFESLEGPGTYFSHFDALGIQGTSFSGQVRILRAHGVPDAGSTWLMASLAFSLLALGHKGFFATEKP